MFALLMLWFALQATKPGIPVEQEPQHRVVLKNDFVRVLDAKLPPGYVTLHHAHDADSVSVTIATGRTTEAPDTRRVGRATFSKGGYSHTVTNSNSEFMRFIVVEAMKSDRPGAAALQLPNHTLETENDRLRIYRVTLAPGESLPSHTHSSGCVEVLVGGPNTGDAHWQAGGSLSLAVSAGNQPLQIVEVEPQIKSLTGSRVASARLRRGRTVFSLGYGVLNQFIRAAL